MRLATDTATGAGGDLADPPATVDVRQASELTGLAQGTIRAAIRRGRLRIVSEVRSGGRMGMKFLIDPAEVMEAASLGPHVKRTARPDEVTRALLGDLSVALTRDLALTALANLERERRRLMAEREAVKAARLAFLRRTRPEPAFRRGGSADRVAAPRAASRGVV